MPGTGRKYWNIMRDNTIVTRTIRQVNCVVPGEHAKSVPQSQRAARINDSHRVFYSVYRQLSVRIVLPLARRRERVGNVNQVTWKECVPGRLSAPHDDLCEHNGSSAIWIGDK